MFGDIRSDTPLSELDEETRMKLARLLDMRSQYLEELARINRIKIGILKNPSPAAEESMTDYMRTVVAPLRRELGRSSRELIKQSIDNDKIKSLLPAILSGILSGVNLQLLFAAIGGDADVVDEMIEQIKEYIED